MQNDESNIYEDGSVFVKDKKIIVNNPIENGKYPIISPALKGTLIINGQIVNRPIMVKEEDIIEFIEYRIPFKRNIDISYNKDNTEAYISITYEKEVIYTLKDSNKSKNLLLLVEENDGEYPPIITKEELISLFKKENITYGILDNVISEIINKREINKIIFAKGKKPIAPIEDKIKIFFASNRRLSEVENEEKIDYRNFNTITSVKDNEILAEIIKGENGVDGIDVFSQIIKAKQKRKIVFTAGSGARIRDNIVTSTMGGKPNFKNNTIWVEPIYILNKDVTIETGNIKFPANVEINGKITEGMKVYSGGSLVIKGGVFSSDIEAKNSTIIKGNIVNSNIKIGGTNLNKSQRIDILKSLRENLSLIITNINYLNDNNLIDKSIGIGAIIKSLIETKFKSLAKTLIKVISCTAKDGCNNSEVIKLVKMKLIGAAPSGIKEISEIEEIIYKIDEELSELLKDVIVEADLNIDYAQESKIDVLGSINVCGNGLFTSELTSTQNIIFSTQNGVCRGGYLKANKMIKVSIVGSESGVFTNLEVEKDGHIYIDLAYHNTTFIIGNKKYILEKPSKNIHVYIDKDGSLAVDKLLL